MVILSTILAATTIGAISGSVLYFVKKEDQENFKNALIEIMNEETVLYYYDKDQKTFIFEMEDTKARLYVKETNRVIEYILDLSVLFNYCRAFHFQFDKYNQTFIHSEEEKMFIPTKKDDNLLFLIENFHQYMIDGEWKKQYEETKKEEISEEKSKQPRREVYVEIEDVDIRYHLQNIQRKIEWLNQTNMLEVEEQHKTEILFEDANNIIRNYSSLRDETKSAFKDKVITALLEIETKLNDLSIKKEEAIHKQMEKTISLIRER